MLQLRLHRCVNVGVSEASYKHSALFSPHNFSHVGSFRSQILPSNKLLIIWCWCCLHVSFLSRAIGFINHGHQKSDFHTLQHRLAANNYYSIKLNLAWFLVLARAVIQILLILLIETILQSWIYQIVLERRSQLFSPMLDCADVVHQAASQTNLY